MFNLKFRLPRPRLVADWRKIRSTYTVRLSMLLTLLSVAQLQWPLFQSFLNPKHFAVVSMILALAIAGLRHVEQPALHDTPEDVPDAKP